MLDVVHVLYEEDITPRHEQDQEVKDAIRKELYPRLYGRPYQYASSKSATRQYGATEEDWNKMPEVDELPGDSKPTKPFIPATNPEDLPGILAPPLN